MNAAIVGAVTMGGVVAGGLAAIVLRPPRRLAQRVRPYIATARVAMGSVSDGGDGSLPRAGGTFEVIVGPFREFSKALGRLLENRSDDALAKRLYQARRIATTPNEFRLEQVSRGFVTALIFGAAACVMARTPVAVMAATICGFIAGSARVRGVLERNIRDRAQRMDLELYTINQLLALHVRSGAGPMQAVQRIVDRGNGELVEEMRSVLTWVRSGQREQDAFRRAAELTPCASAARTYQMFALAAERGSDLGQGLLAVGDDLREVRRESLRKHAVKQRAAMLAPTIGILAPIMLLFVAAPLPSIVLGNH